MALAIGFTPSLTDKRVLAMSMQYRAVAFDTELACVVGCSYEI